jgi:hypothetical protein
MCHNLSGARKYFDSINQLFEAFLNDKLDLVLKIFCLNATKQGLPFLSYRISPFGLRLSPNSNKQGCGFNP